MFCKFFFPWFLFFFSFFTYLQAAMDGERYMPRQSRSCVWIMVVLVVAAALFLWWANKSCHDCKSNKPSPSPSPSPSNKNSSGSRYPQMPLVHPDELQRSAMQTAASWPVAANNPNATPPSWTPPAPLTSVVSGEAYARQHYLPTMPNNVTPRSAPNANLPNGQGNGIGGVISSQTQHMTYPVPGTPTGPPVSPAVIDQAMKLRYLDASTDGSGAPGSLGTVAACAGKPAPGSWYPYNDSLGQALAVDSRFPNEQDPSSTLQTGCTTGANCPADRNSAESQLNVMRLMPASWTCGTKTPDPMSATNPDWSNLAPDRAAFARAVTQQRTVQLAMNTRDLTSKTVGINVVPFRKSYSAALGTSAMPWNDSQLRLGLIMAATNTVPTSNTC